MEETNFLTNELTKANLYNFPSSRTGIVVFSHLRWNFVWQRPQQFLSRFAKEHPVLFLEEPLFDVPDGGDAWLEIEQVANQVTVGVPHLSPAMRSDPHFESTLRDNARKALEACNVQGDFDCPLLWYYTPVDALWSLEYFENCGVIYDCMDELSKFRGAPPALVLAEAFLLDSADVVFTGGYELWLEKRQRHPNVHFLGCGVEAVHFGKARLQETVIPEDIRDLPKPILGWFGVIDERVDYQLLESLAKARPNWSIVMVGPIVKVDPSELPQAPNIHWLGGRDYEDLPSYCKGFDICMMAFALNEATEFINPTKALEYLATGKPVISTPVRDVVRQYSDLVYIENDGAGFVERIEEVLMQTDMARIERGISKAAASSWDSTVAQMRALIADATGNLSFLPTGVSLK